MKIFNQDTIITISIRFFVILSGILGSIISANTLGPEGRGQLVWVTSFALTIANFCYLGLPASNTYLIVKKKKTISRIFSNSLWISMLAGLIGGLTYIILRREVDYLLFLLLQIPCMMLIYFCGNILISIQEVSKYNYVDFVYSLLSLSLIYLFSCFFKNIVFFLLANTISALIATLVAIFFLKKHISFTTIFVFDISLFREGFIYSIKIFAITFIGFLITNGNVFFLDYFSGKKELGYFSIAQQIYNAFLVIPAVLANLLFPQLIRSDNKWSITIKLLRQMSIIMASLCLVTFILVKPFIQIAFGNLFEPSIYIVYSSIPAMFFISLCTIISQYLASIDLPIELVIIWILVFVIWFLLSFILIRYKGGIGVGFSLSITNFILFLLLFYIAKRKSKYSI